MGKKIPVKRNPHRPELVVLGHSHDIRMRELLDLIRPDCTRGRRPKEPKGLFRHDLAGSLSPSRSTRVEPNRSS